MSASKFEAVRALITAVQSLENRRTSEELSSIRAFMMEARAIEIQLFEARKHQAPDFNVFDALAIRNIESVHSRLLAFLFDPRASHAQGTLFLQSFIDRFLGEQALPKPTVEETFVHREFVTTCGCLDVAIFLAEGARICVENKISAPEQDTQISRYQRYLSSERLRGLVVFVTPNGRPPKTIDAASHVPVVSLSYEQIEAWLKALLPQMPPVLQSVLSMYVTTCGDIAADAARAAS